MKVLHVYRTYFPDTQGGLEEVIRQLCLGGADNGIENRVFTLSDRPRPGGVYLPEAKVVQVKKSFEAASCGVSLGGFREFSRQVAWADIVHYHFPWPFADILHFAAGRSKPSILTYHSDIVRQKVLMTVYRPLMFRYLASMDRIVATSPNYFATSEVLSRYAKKVEIIPIGLNEEAYPSVTQSRDDMERIEAACGRNFFLFVGVLRYYKGLHILLDAIQGAPYQVVIVGSGPVENELRAQASRLGLDNVIFTGYVSDTEKMALFKLCRGVVFPSYLRSEAFGVTLLEGAMSSKPLISAEIGSGTSHVNIHGETGLVVPPGNAPALREAMDTLARSWTMAANMGQRARERYEKLFTGSVMAQRYARTYSEVLEQQAVALGLESKA